MWPVESVAHADFPMPLRWVGAATVGAPAMPGLGLPLAGHPLGMAASLLLDRHERVVRMLAPVAIEAQELKPVQRLVPDDGSVAEVMHMDAAAEAAPLTAPRGAGDHCAALHLPGGAVLGHPGLGHGWVGLGCDPPYPVAVRGSAGGLSQAGLMMGRVAPWAALGPSPGSSGDGCKGWLFGARQPRWASGGT